jgi:serine/threonine protein kinase
MDISMKSGDASTGRGEGECARGGGVEWPGAESSSSLRAAQQEATIRKMQTLRWSLNDFRFAEILGAGRASTVFRAQHVSTGMEFAIKKYVASKLGSSYDKQQVKNEIAVHSTLFHPAITSFYGSFQDEVGGGLYISTS